MPDLSNPGEFFAQFGVQSNPLYQIQQTMGQFANFGDPRFRALLGNINQQLAAATNALQAGGRGASRVAALRGARLGQDISSAIGSIGGGSSGVGAVARSLGSSAASGMASESAAQTQQALAQLLFGGAQLTGGLQSDYLNNLMSLGGQVGSNIWGTAMQGFNQQSGILNGLKQMREQQWNPMNLLSSAATAAGPFL